MGLLLVALASAAALGLTAACGIAFNITTTQVRLTVAAYKPCQIFTNRFSLSLCLDSELMTCLL